MKDLHLQIGETHACYVNRVELGTSAVIHSFSVHKLSRVKLDRSDECLMLASNLTKEFVGLGSNMIGMVDGLKLELKGPSDSLEKDHNYNG